MCVGVIPPAKDPNIRQIGRKEVSQPMLAATGGPSMLSMAV